MKGPRCVLIIDDNDRWRRTLRTVFADMGFGIAEAETAEKALESISSQYFDLVLVDLRLADSCSGLDIIKRIKELNLKTGAIVVVTGYADTQAMVTAFRLGADDFLSKGSSSLMEELRLKAHEALHAHTGGTHRQ
jgi:ActR/RegA family two-component response regulator